MPVVLISPDGAVIDTSTHGGPLVGQINYETIVVNPDTGEEIAVNTPNVSLRRSSLSRVPIAGEKWIVRIPISPLAGAPTEDFLISATQPPRGGATIGFIRLYLQKTEQI